MLFRSISRRISLVECKSRRLKYHFVLPDGSIRHIVGETFSRKSGYLHTGAVRRSTPNIAYDTTKGV